MSKKKLIRVTVKADVNDGDYIHKITDVTQEEFDLMKLKRNSTTDKNLKELIEQFQDTYVPWFDNHDVHTIDSISVCDAPKQDWEYL